MAFNLDNVKNLFNTLKEKGTEVASVAADKTKDAARIARLTVDMGTEKENLKKAYLELGKAFYEEHKDSAEGLFAQLCEEVTAVTERIGTIQRELDGLKDGFKPAAEPDFEEVVASAEDEADITVEITESPCESCEQPSCDGCDVAGKKEEPCCAEEKPEEPCCCDDTPAEEPCCCEEKKDEE